MSKTTEAPPVPEPGLRNMILLSPGKNADDYYFPVNQYQVSQLLGKLLTHIDAMGLPERAEKANKDLVRQSFWKWWDEAKDNSLTSYRGCIAPIEVVRDHSNHTESGYRWLGGGVDEEHVVSVAKETTFAGTALEGIVSQIPPGSTITNIANVLH